MFRVLLASFTLFASGAAPEAKNLQISGAAASRDVHCNGHDVDIHGVGHTITLTGVCSSIDIKGAKHSITFEEVDDLDIEGVETTVEGREANSVDVEGRGHRVVLAIDGEDESGELDLAGVDNYVRAKLMSGIEIEVAGRGNTVEWILAEGATKPSITISGVDNTVKQIDQ